MKKLLIAVAAMAAMLGAEAEEWYASAALSGDPFTAAKAPNVWTNAVGETPSGAIAADDICHVQNGISWASISGTFPGSQLHLGATNGSSSCTLTARSSTLTVADLRWHSASFGTGYSNAAQGLGGTSAHAYLDCAGKMHRILIGSSTTRFTVPHALHCDETDLQLVLNVEGSKSGDTFYLTGDNADYRGYISLQAATRGTLLAAHDNTLGDPNTPREDALSVDAANSILAVKKGVKLNVARGIKVNKSGFTLKADTVSSFDCSEYELSMPISGDYGVTKTGAGTVTLSGEYTAKGAIVVSTGTLIIGGAADLPNLQAITVKSGATLEVHQPLSNFTITAEEGATVIESMDTIEVPFDTTTTNVTTVVRTRLQLSPGVKQPFKLSAGYLVPCHDALELEVLRIEPGSADFTGDDFEDRTEKTYGLPRTTMRVTKDEDGTQHLMVSTRPVVVTSSAIGSQANGGINGLASNWSDQLKPHAGADYLIRHNVGSVKKYAFGGDTLTVGNDASLGFRYEDSSAAGLFQTKSGEPVIIYPGVKTGQNYSKTDLFASGSMFLVGDYGDSGVFNFYLSYGETASNRGQFRLEAKLSGAGTLQISGVKNGTSWNGIYGDNTNYFGRIIMTGNGSTAEMKGTQVRVKDGRSFGGRLDEFHSDAVTVKNYAMIKAIADVALTNDMNRGFYIVDNGGFNCDAGKTFRTTWPVQLNGTLYKHGAGTLILGGAISHDTSSTSNFFVRAGAIGILNDAAADGLTVQATNDFAIIVSPESTAVNGFTGLNLAPPPGSDVLPKVTVRADSAKFAKGVSYKLPICTVANDSGITADTFVVERVPRYCCSIVAEPVDATTTRYSLNCAKPGLFIVVQ